ncbi:hypothetical protein [Pseudomonas palleroniana]|uniref:hypothetical protein n=1 Tax=Pseudomonas palleroniana TaxID=191390 RepID=UPI001FD3C1D6|nr:hypothetical protein [Pseudomonas palleroniana]UOP12661.1 hypothetical protein LDL65_09000 [Pseudomonas palleroniana]
MATPTYKVFSQLELLYSTDANANTPFTETIIGIDRKNPACVDYTVNNKNYATHSNTSGLMIRTAPSALIKKGYIVDIYIDNLTKGTTLAYQFTLTYELSGAIYLPQKEMEILDEGNWDLYGSISTPAASANYTVYAILSKYLQVKKP